MISSLSADGRSTTFSVVVGANAPGNTVPTGAVDFFDATTKTDLGSLPLSRGDVSGTLSTASLAGQTIVATYSGDSNFSAPSSAGQSFSPAAPETPFDVMAVAGPRWGPRCWTRPRCSARPTWAARDAIKLAFNDSGTVPCSSRTCTWTPCRSTAGRPTSPTPTTCRSADSRTPRSHSRPWRCRTRWPRRARDYGKTLARDGRGHQRHPGDDDPQEDFYAFSGQAGQLMNVQVISNNDTFNPQPIIPELVLVGPEGQVLAYNLHEFESPDSTLSPGRHAAGDGAPTTTSAWIPSGA